MSSTDQELRQKWDRRHTEAEDLGRVAAVLEQNLHLLPASGQALDLACGRGANALRLAEAGLRVFAWDLSPVAIDRLDRAAAERGLGIETEVRDVIVRPPAADSFDLILVSYFLERSLVPCLTAALRPGGLLFYQTFSRNSATDCGPSNQAFRLADNELLEMFRTLRVRFYREDGQLGDLNRGERDIALLVAEKSD